MRWYVWQFDSTVEMELWLNKSEAQARSEGLQLVVCHVSVASNGVIIAVAQTFPR